MEVAAPLPPQDYNDRLNELKRGRSMDEMNHDEIIRLRERSHEHGNVLQRHEGAVERMGDGIIDVDKKLDAIHLSLKEDLIEIKTKQDLTNGRVTSLERRYSELKGIGIAFGAGVPFMIFALAKIFS